ncbi:MAG: hypothetical protein HFJ75_06785 [Eggerthellaceae bacterium]|nr:hypothetical protein [Eggerthellaceae bacterium]
MPRSRKVLYCLLSVVLVVGLSFPAFAFGGNTPSADTEFVGLSGTEVSDLPIEGDGASADSRVAEEAPADGADLTPEGEESALPEAAEDEPVPGKAEVDSVGDGEVVVAEDAAVQADESVAAPVAASSRVVPSAERVSFVYVDLPVIAPNGSQNIAVSLLDETVNLSDAVLTMAGDAGEEREVKAEAAVDGMALFSFSVDGWSRGTWSVRSLSYETVEGPISLDFSDCDIAQFVVRDGAPVEYQKAQESEADVSFYTLDAAGDIQEADTIGEAIQDAEAAAPATFSTRRSARSASRAGTLVVALDPGHGGSDPGAIGVNSAQEAVLTWKIASYCKQELETYTGVKVVMTKTQPETLDSIETRVKRAVDEGANVVVSIHLNSFNGSAYGAEVWVPNASGYNHDTHTVGTALGNKIIDELAKLGLTNRGVKINNSLTGKDPTGYASDYYGISRYARQYNIPGIIVEHAFIDNQGDYSKYLSDESKLRALGVADATGIANQYGLAKWSWNAQASTVVNTDGTATVTVSGVGAPSDVTAVSIPVWGLKGGQNDLVWYPAKKQSNGNWVATVPLAKHGEVGEYAAHVYASAQGRDLCVAETSFTVSPATGSVKVVSCDKDAGTIVFEASVSSPFGIRSMALPVWCATVGGQDDIRWYSMTPKSVNAAGNGTYRVTVNMIDHASQAGEYVAHGYAVDGLGDQSFIGSASQTLSLPSISIKAQAASDGLSQVITVQGGRLGLATSVAIPVWSVAGGQDDVIWYPATKNVLTGAWTVKVPLSNHRTAGVYNVHCYATIGGSAVYMGATEFEHAEATGTVKVISVDAAKGTMTLQATVSSSVGVSQVKLPVWCATVGGQDDIRWYDMSKHNVYANGSGTYRLTVDIADHWFQSGEYQAHLYVTDKIGAMVCADTTSQTLKMPPMSLGVVHSNGSPTYTLTAKGGRLSTATSVAFPTWSAPGGQDDIIWYPGVKNTLTGEWTAVVPIKNHQSVGSYNAHCYMTVGKSQAFVGETKFEVAAPKGTVTATPNAANGTVTFEASLSSEYGISSAVLPVWAAPGGQDDIVWYRMAASKVDSKGNGTYRLTVNMANHNFQEGVYNAHCYAVDGLGIQSFVSSTTQAMSVPKVSVTCTAINGGKSYRITASGGKLAKATSVAFPTWSAANGQDDIVWYPGTKSALAGEWTATVNLSNHLTAGTYYSHVYQIVGGAQSYAGSVEFTVAQSTINQFFYPVMGSSATSVDQMVRMWNKQGRTYPNMALAAKGAPDIRTFCTILDEEARAEGVKTEVLWAQVLLETGWLQSDFAQNRCNFGGLGAVDSSPTDANTFPNVRTGLRAQVQHLKAYASTAPLNNPCVDVRFQYVKRGIAPYVDNFGGKSDGTLVWASDKDYAAKLRNLINQLAAC